MRKISLALLILCAALGAAGCAKRTTHRYQVTEMKQEKSPDGRTVKETLKLKSENGTESTVTTQPRQATEKGMGLPFYPGARQKDDFTTGSTDKGDLVLMVSFTTDDSFEQVMAFYRKSLKGFKESEEKQINGSRFSGFRRPTPGNNAAVVVESAPGKPTSISMTVERQPGK